jgi:putative aldouronate transport system substrate-binding protein
MKISQQKKWVVSTAALCMLAGTVLAGCSEKGASSPSASPSASSGAEPSATATSIADPYADLPKAVSISAFDRGAVSSDEGTYENNRWVKWIREQSGIDVTMVPVPRNQAQDKLNVLIASNQAPDLIWEYDRAYIGKLITQGALQPVDAYIEQYSTSYKTYLQEHPELLPYLTFDGQMYAVATARTTDGIANHGLWIRQDWLDKLGLKTPTTMDELIEVAKAFKEQDPDGNKQDDTTALVGSTVFDSYAAMNAAIGNQWYLENGSMKYGATLDRFGDAMELEKQMYEAGLVDKEYLTDKNFQRAIQLWTTGKAGIFAGSWGGSAMENHIRNMLKNEPEANPVPLEPVSTKNGKFGLYQETPPNIFVAFNKEMKNPKAAVEYLDWMVDEGWKSLVNGEEGVHYKDVSGVAQMLDAEKFKKEVSYAGEYAVVRDAKFSPEDLLVKAAPDEISQRLAALSQKGLETATRNKFRRDIPYQPNFTELNDIQTALKPFIEEVRAKVTMQGSQYTSAWGLEEIRKEWTRLGGEAVEVKAQEWYEANKANF